MKHSIIIPGLLLLVASLVLVACGGAAPQYAVMDSGAMEMPAAAPAAPQEFVEVENEMIQSDGANSEIDIDGVLEDRKVIYNADMNLVVADTEAAALQAEELAEGLGGYVANMNAYQGGENTLFYNITMRVPSDQFDTMRNALRDMALRVENESVHTNDVTDQYFDLDARLRTLRATEEELLVLLKETRERGGEVEDIMSIYRELTNIQSQIESLQGQLNRLEKLVALSTIEVRLQPDVLNQPLSTSWRPLETLHNSFELLINALQGLIDVLIYAIVVVLPILLLLAIPVAILVLFIRWLVRRTKATDEASE